MAFKFGKAAAMASAATIPSTRIMPDTKETQRAVESEIRRNEVALAAQNELLNQREEPTYIPPAETVIAPDGSKQEAVESKDKLDRLLADDFPFDESQLAAINGIANQRFACMTGAAGTGKTTSTKAIVDRIQDGIGRVDMSTYFKRGKDDEPPMEHEDDDYESTDEEVPSIALVGFTGRSTQMIKKNFPRSWHPNIMTIHRMLAFMPEFYEDYDPETDSMRNKMRFIPTYTKHFKLPWDVIVIDEAGMVSIELWQMVWDACKAGVRIIMIGDINQLPPVHGRSIFGFAMTQWPSWELTHVHRQVGVNNSIVDNAWKILKGIKPVTDDYKADPKWKFAMMPIPDDSALASQKIRKWLQTMNGKAYQPHRDSVITAINGEDTSRGYALGQIPMNRELAIVFNKDSPRYIIDAGRERKQFACGDKVMATRNDHEAGITNGMTGVITQIARNGGYAGDWQRFGEISEVSRYLADIDEPDEEDISLDDISDSYAAIDDAAKSAKESKDRGPASHTVTVRFGEGDHAFEIPFATLAEVNSLMVAYVVTCHKMQGGESPLVVVICHQAHKAMLNREWLYTAVTRASAKCVLFYTDLGLRAALNKQRITGSTLAQKVKVFQDLQTKGLVGAALNVALPAPESLGTDIEVAAPRTMVEQVKAEPEANAERVNALQERIKRMQRERAKPEPEVIERVVERVIIVEREKPGPERVAKPDSPRDGGDLKAERDKRMQDALKQIDRAQAAKPIVFALPAPARPTHTPTQLYELAQMAESLTTFPLMLTHQPLPTPESGTPVTVRKTFRFGVK